MPFETVCNNIFIFRSFAIVVTAMYVTSYKHNRMLTHKRMNLFVNTSDLSSITKFTDLRYLCLYTSTLLTDALFI
jgi:hypothetical protein